MRLVEPDAELAQLLDEYRRGGGVVEYAIFDLDPPDVPCHDLFREAAIAAVRQLEPRTDIAAAQKIEGELQAAEQFFGPRWSARRRAFLVRGRSGFYFYANDDDSPAHAIDLARFVDELGSGYAHAFCDPPYPITLSSKRLSELFVEINVRLAPYGMDKEDTHIYKWPTDWSPYFDAGNDWWGSYLWTVWARERRIVAILASASD